MTSQKIRQYTRQDSVLSKVLSYTLKGWPSQVPKVLQPYHTKLAELSVEEGCLLWGRRVIISQRLQEVISQEQKRRIHLDFAGPFLDKNIL